MKQRGKGINEIKITLLPEKSKRDYILRLVSSIIVLLFVIINLVFVYLPYNSYNSQLNELRSDNAEKKLELQYLQSKYNFIYHDIYNKNDNSIKDILDSSIDFRQIMKMFDGGNAVVTYIDLHDNLSATDLMKPENKIDITPLNSEVEYIIYTEADKMFTVSIQFDNMDDLFFYENQIGRIQYLLSLESGAINPVVVNDNDTNYRKIYYIRIDPQNSTCPKVEGYK